MQWGRQFDMPGLHKRSTLDHNCAHLGTYLYFNGPFLRSSRKIFDPQTGLWKSLAFTIVAGMESLKNRIEPTTDMKLTGRKKQDRK